MAKGGQGRTLSQMRSRARWFAVQALYQWQLSGQNLHEIEQQFLDGHEIGKCDVEYFSELLHQVPAHLDEVDARLRPFLDRPVEEVDPVERAILRIGAYEFGFRPDVPYRVVINEAVELAKTFGAEQGHKYVNGVLDKVAKELRAVEMRGK
ncbi:MAG: transcription antitermination factor NusB [Gammaproteobacteria bacterium]